MLKIIFFQPFENGKNGFTNFGENSCIEPDCFDLNGTNLLEDSNEKKEEMIAKFLRHRKILMSNCEQAEQEIRRVDEIYHDTINYVLEARFVMTKASVCILDNYKRCSS